MNSSPYRHLQTRRVFLRDAACAALTTAGITAAIRDLRIIGSAVAQTPLTDYKALVCLFLSGGNDANNLIVPRSTSEYANYASIRGNLAIPQTSLLSIAPSNNDGHDYGLHPSCIELQTLFAEQKLAMLFNAGTLVYPMTRTQYSSNSVAKPPQLFSHSDQVTQWQTSIPDQQPKSGWGGRCADLLQSLQPDARISLCTSIAGQNIFEVGNVVQQYHVSTTGAVAMTGLSGTSTHLKALKDLLALDQVNLQQGAFADVVDRSLATGELLNSAIGATTAATYWNPQFSGGSLGQQLRMVARLIQARSALTMKRQIFFVSVGSYDTHTGQVGDAANPANTTVGTHANLLNDVSEGLFAFQRAMEQLGLSDKVTTFTASVFGRTFPTNGVGSDHGWGSHHLVVGGAVSGRKTYGTFPVHTINGPDDTNTGRWIPTTSIDQYSATLATWFGVTPSDLAYVFPNLGRFATPNLGFML